MGCPVCLLFNLLQTLLSQGSIIARFCELHIQSDEDYHSCNGGTHRVHFKNLVEVSLSSCSSRNLTTEHLMFQDRCSH